MGSFNVKCFVSQQTIIPGHEAIIFPIVQQSTFKPVELIMRGNSDVVELSRYGYANNTCHHTSFWGFYGPIIIGCYDDYGRFTISESELNERAIRAFLNKLSDRVYDVKPGDNEYHEHPLVFSDLYCKEKEYSFAELVSAWDTIWDLAQEARLFVRNYKGEPASVAFATMHKVVGDYLLENMSKRTTWDNRTLEPKSFFKNYFIRRLESLFAAIGQEDSFNNILFVSLTLGRLEDFRIGSEEGSFIGEFYRDSNVTARIKEYFELNPESRTISDEVLDEFYELFKPEIEHRYISSAINEPNIKLMPMSYAGQDYDNEMGNKFLEIVQESNKRVNQLIQSEQEEYEEGDEGEE